MPAAVTVKAEGIEELSRRLREASPEVRKLATARMRELVNELRDAARGRVRSVSGRARKGIVAKLTTPERGLRGLVGREARATMGGKAVVAGIVRPGGGVSGKAALWSMRTRAPGRPGPPPAAALIIARRYGDGTEQSAYALGRIIAERGTKGNPVMDKTLAAKQSRVTEAFREVMDLLGRNIARK